MKTCSSCGTNYVDGKVCPSCGAPSPDDASVSVQAKGHASFLKTMKGKITVIVAAVLVVILFFVIMGPHRCDICNDTYFGIPHGVSVFGEKLSVCGDCNDSIEEIQSVFE